MCGIFGTRSFSKRSFRSTEIFLRLGLLVADRGNRQWGYAGNWGEEIHQFDTPFLGKSGQVVQSAILLGNTRAATDTTNTMQIHPRLRGDLILAHNGILPNHKDVDYPSKSEDFDLDSDALLDCIYRYRRYNVPLAHAIAQSAQMFGGQQACWLMDLESREIFLWRIMSPIYVGRIRSTYCFASTKFTGSGDDPIKEGVVYRFGSAFSVNDPVIEPTNTFDYTSFV